MKDMMEQIEVSTCFGVAFDAVVKECKICDIKLQCSEKTKGGKTTKLKKPESPLESIKTKFKGDEKEGKPAKVKTTKAETKGDLPDFKSKTMGELEKLAEERGADDSWKKHDNEGIRRMRLTMSLKKTY